MRRLQSLWHICTYALGLHRDVLAHRIGDHQGVRWLEIGDLISVEESQVAFDDMLATSEQEDLRACKTLNLIMIAAAKSVDVDSDFLGN
ncbi:MAG: hypothetical protein AAGF94_03800 [Pseudomonadota bacterium]